MQVVLAGLSILLIAFAHAKYFGVKVDKIYPECFRKNKYAACDYYKEFYDPAYHKVEKPFANEANDLFISKNKYKRNDFDKSNFVFAWKGRNIFSEKAFLRTPPYAEIKSLPPADTQDVIQLNDETVKIKTNEDSATILHKII